jgi:hypothetical protein
VVFLAGRFELTLVISLDDRLQRRRDFEVGMLEEILERLLILGFDPRLVAHAGHDEIEGDEDDDVQGDDDVRDPGVTPNLRLIAADREEEEHGLAPGVVRLKCSRGDRSEFGVWSLEFAVC